MDLSATAAGLDPARAADPAAYAIGGRTPRAAVRPVSYEEVAEALRAAAADHFAVVPWGGGAGLEGEEAPPRYDLALDLRALDRVVEHEPADYTLTAQCGVTIESLAAALAARGQELPIEAPRAARATLGGALAANAAGPRRIRFGAPRDRVLGARFALADGTLARSGGKVVKNVAGYGIHRLLCGSRGGLAVLLEVSLKLATAPAARLALAWGADSRGLADAARWAAFPRLEPAVFTVVGSEHAPRLPTALRAAGGYVVVLGFEDEPARVVELEALAVRALGPPQGRLEAGDAAAAWPALADLESEMPPGSARVTAHPTPAALAPLLDAEHARALVFHAAGGRLLLAPGLGADPAEHGFPPIGGTEPKSDGVPQQALLALRARVRSALDPSGVLAFGERWARAGG